MCPPHPLPRYVYDGSLRPALRFCADVSGDKAEVVVCDAANLTFVDPAGLCLLVAVCHSLSARGKSLRIINISDSMKGFLSRMDLFKACGIHYDEKFNRHDRSADLVEVCVLDNARSVDEVARKVSYALVGRMPDFDPSAPPDEMTGYQPHDHLYIPLEYVFVELLENALTHGKRAGRSDALAWVAAQYYSSRDLIRLAVLDNGCGFLASLQSHSALVEKSHLAATRLALQPRVTCNPDFYVASQETANQGVGLTVVKEIVSRGGGVMRLVTGNSLLELKAGDRESHQVTPTWGGVLLAIELERKQLRQLNLSTVIQSLIDESAGGLRFE